MQGKLLYLINKTKTSISILIIVTFSILITAIIANIFKFENQILLLVIQQLIFITPAAILLFNGKTTLADLGFNSFFIFKGLKSIILAYLGFIALNLLVLSIITTLGIELPGYGQQQSYAEFFEGNNIYIVFFLIAILVPICEEILFRGLIFAKIVGSNNFKIAVSSLLFAGYHFQFEVIIPLFILGCIIGYLRVQNNSIYPAIIFHILNNSLAFYVQFLLK